jgi:hypothetical protein
MSPSNRALWLALVVIIVHLALSVVHGMAHSRLEIALSHAQEVFVTAVILVAPLVAGFLLLVKLPRAGGALLAVSMAGALLFGVYYHFIAISSDHVTHLPAAGPGEWKLIFQTTAVLLALTEVLGCWAGIWVLKSLSESKTN